MDRKVFLWTAGLCFVAAFVAAALSIGIATGHLRMNPVTTLVGIATLYVAVGWRVYETLSDSAKRLERSRIRYERLSERFEIQKAAIDDLADNLDVALFICTPKGGVLYANRRAMSFFRLEEYRDRTLLAITLSHELEAHVQIAAEGETTHAELNFSYPQDWVGAVKAWQGSDGRIFLSIYEITELRRLERIRSDFVANVSHEMRTPMTIIRAMSETLLDDDDADLKERYLTKIIGEVDRLSTISQDLLVLSAAESNPVRKQSCDIACVLKDIINQLTPRAHEKGLELTYVGPDKLILAANPAQMIQVALNLVENALNYTPEGGVTVDLRQAGTEVVFSVADTGIGVPSDHLARIFERFYRVDKARSRFTGGTGLGLSIVKHIVEAHGGRIEVKSILNAGSTFTVRLPVADSNS
ncbi:hypothetical protein EON79_12255 [bacterium]|nr:MAG: hypothetical protein EON79_12255 [bacterium]